MTSEPTETYVIFRSTLFSFEWPDKDPDIAPPWGEDCAEFIKERLQDFNKSIKIGGPYQAVTDWRITVKLPGERYELYIHWAPIGEPTINYWAIQVCHIKDLLSWLLNRPPQHFPQLLEDLSKMLDSTEGITDVQWMNFDEFSKVY